MPDTLPGVRRTAWVQHTKSAVRPPRHTSVATSDLGDLLVISARPLYRYYTSRPQELALLIVLSVAQHPPFGTL